MLTSIVKSKGLTKAIPLVPEHHQKPIKRYLILNHCLRIFFFFGYFVTLAAFIFQYTLVSEAFVSVIFLLGAILVFLDIDVQSRLLSEMQTTLQGMLPICTNCKKIRITGGNPKDPKAWEQIENYIAERADVNFSHGYCPECFEKEMKNIDKTKDKACRSSHCTFHQKGTRN